MGRNFLEKMGLVERVQPKPLGTIDEDYLESLEQTEEQIDVEVETENITEDNFISDIYNNNDLSDLSKSIFKVEEISMNLPDTMPKETKQASVIGILSSFQLTPESVKTDADERIVILNAALGKIESENNELISAKQEEIENAKRLIEECQKTIAICEHSIESSTEKVMKEVKRINALKDFVTIESLTEGEGQND